MPVSVGRQPETRSSAAEGVRAGNDGSIRATGHQRQLRDNLPQAFVHAGLLECAVRLSPDIRLGA